VADVLIAAMAFEAVAASGHKRHRHSLPDKRTVNIAANLHYRPSKLVSRHMRELAYIRIVPPPAMPVAAAKPRRFNPNHSPIRSRRRIRQAFDGDWPAKLVVSNGFHRCLYIWCAREPIRQIADLSKITDNVSGIQERRSTDDYSPGGRYVPFGFDRA